MRMGYYFLSISLAINIGGDAVASNGIRKPSLCGEDENIVFSCATSVTRSVSVCASRNEAGLLSYQFGAPDKVELSYPSENESPDFYYNKYSRYQTEYLRLGFSKNHYYYYIFKDSEYSRVSYGISIYQDGHESDERIITCKSSIIDNLDVGLKHAKCNGDSALGCEPPAG